MSGSEERSLGKPQVLERGTVAFVMELVGNSLSAEVN